MVPDIKFPKSNRCDFHRHAQIVSMGIGIPKRVVTNQEIIDTYNIMATDRAVQYSLGINERRWVGPEDSLEKLMKEAVNQCLYSANIDVDKIDRVIFTRLLGDCQIPSSSIKLLSEMKTEVGIPAFDMTCACSGFVQGMDLAVKYIDSGDEYVLLIGGGITSKGIQDFGKPDPKTVFLMGDAVVAAVIGHSQDKHFFSSYIFTNPGLYDNAFIPYGSSTMPDGQVLEGDIFNMKVVNGNLIEHSSVLYTDVISNVLLQESGYNMDEIDYFITSDQSTKIWEAQLKTLNLSKDKSVSTFYKYGNTAAAMTGLNLYELINTGKLKRKDIVMMMAHGAGSTSGGIIFKY